MKFLRSLSFYLLPTLVGCGAPLVSESRPPEPGATAAASATSSEAPPTAPARASQQGLVAAAKADALRALLGRVIGPKEVGALERDLGIPAGSLSSRAGLAALGISPDGVVTLETFELDEGATSEVKRLRAIDRAAPDAEIGEALTLESRRVAEGWFLSRLRLPLERGSNARQLFESALARNHASRWQSPTSGITVLGLRGSLWVLRDVSGALEVAVAMGHRDLEAKDARRAVAALSAWGDGAIPDLAGDDVRAVIHPSVVAEAGLWLGVARTVDVGFGDGIEPELSHRLLAQGFREASQAIRIEAPSGTSRYGEVALRVKGSEAVVRSTLAKDMPALDASAWSTDAAAASDVVSSVAKASVVENGALAFSWPLLPPTQGINPYRGGDALSAMREAGFAGWVLAFADAPFLVARISLENAEPIGQATLPFMRRFERLGVSDVEGKPLYLGLLSKSATDEQAACSLARTDDGCSKADRLPGSGVVSMRGFFVGRRKLGGRWVVVASPKKELADKARITIVPGPRPASRLVLDLDQQLGAKQLGSYRIEVAMSPDARSFETTWKPMP